MNLVKWDPFRELKDLSNRPNFIFCNLNGDAERSIMAQLRPVRYFIANHCSWQIVLKNSLSF